MTLEVFYILGFVITILIIWTIPNFRNIFKNYRPELLAFASAYFFLLCDIKNNDTTKVIFERTWKELNPLLIIIAIILGLIGIGMNIEQKKSQKNLETLNLENSKLENKLNEIKNEYFKVCSDIIKFMFIDFFNTSDGNGRVSIYKHQDENFILLGRYSKNPIYNKRGREVYSDKEGFISKGWENQEFTIFNSPRWIGNGRDYKSFMKNNCFITDETLKKLTMKSCSFFILRIENEDARNPLGVIVFEKISNSEININSIKETINNNKLQIETLIKSMKTIH